MADKELESPPPQKPMKQVQFQSPNLLTSKVSPSEQTSTQARDHRDNNYHSVSQKAKLILPTALWILIVVAGLCFLSLLSSLNKSINTLDTLVEIEQANAKNRHHHEHRHVSAPASAEPLSAESDGDEFSKRGPPKVSSSWLSLPGWTSLEPTAHHQKHAHKHQKTPSTNQQDEELSGNLLREIMDDMMKNSPFVGGDKLLPASGEIIITSSSSMPDDREPGEVRSLLSGLDSMFKQVLGSNAGQQTKPSAGTDFAQSNQVKGDGDKSMITANIDTININFNDHDSNKKSSANKKRKPKPSKEASDLGDSIEKMLDEMNNNMDNHDQPEAISFGSLGQPRPRPPAHHHHNHHHQAHQTHQGHPITILGADEGTGMSLSNLLLPPSLSMDEIAPSTRSKPTVHHNFSPFDGLLPPGVLDQSPGAESFVIQLGGPDQRPTSKRPSPYDLTPSIIDQLIGGQPTKPTEFDSNLANSILQQTLFPGQQESSSTAQKKDPFGAISDVDVSLPGLDILDGSKKSGDSEQSQQRKENKNSFQDLFKLFFGPPPNSSLVVAPQLVEPKISTLAPASGEPSTISLSEVGKKVETINKESPSSISENKEVDLKPTTIKSLPTIGMSAGLASPEPTPDKSAATAGHQENKEQAISGSDPLIDDFLGTMFSLPQMSGQSGPVRADTQQSGGSSSNTGGDMKGANSNSRGGRESMMCECQKTGSGPSSSGMSVGNSSPQSRNSPSDSTRSSPSASSSTSFPSSSSRNPSSQTTGLSSSTGLGSASGALSSESRSQPSSQAQSSSSSASNNRSSNSSYGSGQSSSSGSGTGPVDPMGYVQMYPPNPPAAFAFSDNRSQPSSMPRSAGQSSGSSAPRQVDGNFARPGSMLAVLNNSTGGAMASLLHRLNSTNYPLSTGHSPQSLGSMTHQISLLIRSSSDQSTPSSLAMSDISGTQTTKSPPPPPVSITTVPPTSSKGNPSSSTPKPA